MQESRSSVPAFNGRTLIRCSECDVVYLDEQPTAAELEGINSRYWDVADDCGAFVSLVHEAQMASRVDYLTSRLGSLGGLAVLDVGAGPGLLQRALRRTGQAVNYHAIEPDADCWPRLMREGAVKIWTGLRECDKRSFDLVVLSHVLEHVGDPLDFLEGVSGLSSTGGSIFIEVPNQDYLHKNNLGTHLLFFSPPSLRRLLELKAVPARDLDTVGPLLSSLTAARETTSRPAFRAARLPAVVHRAGYRVLDRIRAARASVQTLERDLQLSAYGGSRQWIRCLAGHAQT